MRIGLETGERCSCAESSPPGAQYVSEKNDPPPPGSYFEPIRFLVGALRRDLLPNEWYEQPAWLEVLIESVGANVAEMLKIDDRPRS